MRKQKLSATLSMRWIAMLTIFAGTLFPAVRAAAQTESVLINLNMNSAIGGDCQAGLISDAAGNLYGATVGGGPGNGGTVFELSPNENGSWTAKVLHHFLSGVDDGDNPHGTLAFDPAGNLYGTTFYGGASNNGTVFELIPQSNGNWKEKQLHAFTATNGDGQNPQEGVTLDSAGNVYGTTYYGGTQGYGMIFQLSPQSNGGWKEKIVHDFNDNGVDGLYPYAGLALDASGNLYGATQSGGAAGAGTIFRFVPKAGGWSQEILHDFPYDNGVDGYSPQGAPIFDASGNLYGTTSEGGASDRGTVFELLPQSGGGWTEEILHNFADNGVDGYYPYASLVFDASGNLYGTSVPGGAYGDGAVFKLEPMAGGGWSENTVYSFAKAGGIYPSAALIVDAAGNLYGTTDEGGVHRNGTVFEIKP
jgi:uncharacterized repeat protein (TIGR03803 family)